MSLTVTELLVATTVPEVEPVRIWITMVSEPSVVESLFKVRLNDPELLVIVNDPEFTPLLKSPAAVVPELVQYSVVLLATLVVVTVQVIVPPSLVLAALGDTAYVGVPSLTVTVAAVATMVPLTVPVRSCMIMVSEPS